MPIFCATLRQEEELYGEQNWEILVKTGLELVPEG